MPWSRQLASARSRPDNVVNWAMPAHPTYLWTLPMFHCNGWCYPWTITALAGVHVFLRRVDPAKILTLIRDEEVTHLCGAPIVLNTLVNAPAAQRRDFSQTVEVFTAGAPVAPATLADCLSQ